MPFSVIQSLVFRRRHSTYTNRLTHECRTYCIGSSTGPLPSTRWPAACPAPYHSLGRPDLAIMLLRTSMSTAKACHLPGPAAVCCWVSGAVQSWSQCSYAAGAAEEPSSSSTSSTQQAAGQPMQDPTTSGRSEAAAAATGASLASSSQQPPQQRAPVSYGPRLVQPLRARGSGAVVKQEGIVHVNNSLNNTILVLTDKAGTVKTWTSSGSVGYKNAGKASPIATEAAAAELARRALAKGFYSAIVKLNGAGQNKQFAVQSLSANGLHVTQLQEVTAVPHNGCRKSRRRRV